MHRVEYVYNIAHDGTSDYDPEGLAIGTVGSPDNIQHHLVHSLDQNPKSLSYISFYDDD